MKYKITGWWDNEPIFREKTPKEKLMEQTPEKDKKTTEFVANVIDKAVRITHERICKKCYGNGWYIVANGTEDYDKEVCDCQLT